MIVVTPNDVHSASVAALGLDAASLDLSSIESIAALLRRSASLMCPCSARLLSTSVVSCLTGLADETRLTEDVEQTLSAMIAYGDLHVQERHENEGDADGRLVYISPPSFVRRANGSVILIGITPDLTSPLPSDLTYMIEYTNHVRRLGSEVRPDLPRFLLSTGFIEIPEAVWLEVPGYDSPSELLAYANVILEKNAQHGDIDGLTIIEPSKQVTYYRGRWVIPTSHTGRFVGRRVRKYGPDIWCYVDLANGRPRYVLDLPMPRSQLRGCDWAWYIQAAIDSVSGHPQQFCVIKDNRDSVLVKFFSPLPMFIQRRWDIIGQSVPASGCLFAYRFSPQDLEQELEIAQKQIWLSEKSQ